MVVGQHAHHIARTELVADLGEVAVGPVVDDFVGHREPLHRREHGARVAHGDAVAEHLRDARSSAAVKSTAPKMIMRGGQRERLDEDGDGLLARLAVLSVVTRRRDAGLRARRARRGRRRGRDRRRRASPRRAADPAARAAWRRRSAPRRRSRARPVRAARSVSRNSSYSAHQSIGSTNRWIVPPHVRPTANASSSE